MGGREVNVWRPNAARRSNLGFSSPGEWAKPHFNKLGFPVINPWMKGSDQEGAWDRPQPTSSTVKSELSNDKFYRQSSALNISVLTSM